MASTAPSPLMDDAADGRQPVDAERVLCLRRDHGRDRDGRRLLAVSPALVHQVQVAMHPGHLVGGEAVGAVIVWGRKQAGLRVRARRHAPFLLAKLFRGLLREGWEAAACGGGSAAGALRCRVSPKPQDGTALAAPRPCTCPAPAPGQRPHRTAGRARGDTELLLWLRPGRTNTSPLPLACLWGTEPKGVGRLVINNNNNNNKSSFRTGEQGTHRQEQPWCVSREPLAGREGWTEVA